eukprot:scaffold144340_cov99-Phaeocystis_antarctica.AAC.1
MRIQVGWPLYDLGALPLLQPAHGGRRTQHQQPVNEASCPWAEAHDDDIKVRGAVRLVRGSHSPVVE